MGLQTAPAGNVTPRCTFAAVPQYRSSATPCDFQTTHRCIPAREVS